ncbi:uncharacterized protein EDB93DRAFT_1109340 [Suillus bovinus]|uniref:uncharacterized protein n=1 Tax=Suillus bovinus TaxID=48563 RepID=UPI001B884A50|nr:uncharacterized protein EDB93DRAFT_1109340 [Suillus bovinus]KAG2127269.1 hypothetical protein EDB93DRAFT_1109340 [Suillus bovinus]
MGEVWRLFKDIFNISQDADFILHQAASREDAYAYKYEDGPGPNSQDLAFDLTCGLKSPWNDKVISLLLAELQRRGLEERWLFRRVTVLDHLIGYKADEDEEDLPAWKWLQQLVGTLGEGGMSSEESDIENDIKTVLRIKNMTWRHAVEHELDIINQQRILDGDIFASQGSKPMKRIRLAGNPMTSRMQVDGLPKALYDKEWLAGLTKREVETLSISEETFKWVRVAVV